MCVRYVSRKYVEPYESLEFARTNLDDLVCLSDGHFDAHIEDNEKILNWLRNTNLHIHAIKSSFGETKINYLGYVVICKRITPKEKN